MLTKARTFLEGTIANKFKDFFYSWTPSQRTVFSPDRCCLSIDHEKLLFLHVHKAGQRIEIRQAQRFNYREENDIRAILTPMVEQAQLEGVRCTWILGPETYQLLQTEALPVAPQEFQSAIRWKIKDLIRFPVEDAVIDSFSLPPAKLPTSVKTIMLVIARASFLKPICEQINESGLQLTNIDIPELSFRNFNVLYEKDEKSTAMLYLQQEHGQMILTHQKQFYFSRILPMGLQALFNILNLPDHQAALDQFTNEAALEMQRSFDYFQSQWRLPEPARVFLEAESKLPVNLAELLSQRLNIPVNPLDLTVYFDNKTSLDLKTEGYLPLLGGILKEWEKSYATGH